ncbi:Uncharacterized protein APZ42_005993, partial [Daphnia magna]
ERQVVMTYVKHAAAKPGNNGFKCGMRYEPGFLIECLLLRMKSSKAYHHLRANKILPLPGPSTLRRLISSSDCGFGLNQLALENIAKVLNKYEKQPHLRYGTLMWDEMSIRKDLTWDSRMMKWNGIINFGSDSTQVAPQELCDHVLVLLFRPLRDSWVQPIGWFASKGAANYKVLTEIIFKAIVMLYRSGAIVKCVVCDGHSCNKAALKNMNISCAKETDNHFLHPLNG